MLVSSSFRNGMSKLKPCFAFAGIFFVFLSLNLESKADKLSDNSQSQCLTHRYVTPPPSVKGENPTLFVGLKSQLGYKSDKKEKQD